MKNILDEIKTVCRQNRIEILLMCAFLCAVTALNADEVAQEAAVWFGAQETVGPATEDGVPGEENTKAGTEMKGSEMETEPVSGMDSELETEPVSGVDSELETELVSGMDSELESESGSESDSGLKSEMESELESGAESEIETAYETAAETEKILTEEEAARAARRELSRLGNGFRIPMRMPEETADREMVYRVLADTRKLRDYEVLTAETLECSGLLPEGLDIQALPQETEGQSLTLLEKMVENRISEYDGDWSVYVKNLSTDESFTVNDRPMKSASVMKLFIMGTVYKAFESGKLERTEEVMKLVNDMITLSDNYSSNQLLYLLGDSSYAEGIARVDEFIDEYGFSDMTIEYNGFNDPTTTMRTDAYNQVAAKDCGKLLEDIYRRTWVNREISNEMESMLLAQNTRYKIPAGLPDGVLCGNKSGEMDTTENDAAIIYGEDCDYILVVLSSDWSSKDTAISRIREISAMVYEFLNE